MKNKVLITGACGFIGSHLTELFVKKGFSVIAFDRYNSENNYGWLENSIYKKDIEFILGDIRDYDSVFNAMQNTKYCIHLAALIGIPYSYISPLAYIRTNIEGTYNILESAKNLGLDKILITSTSEVYGSAQYTPMDESHPKVGQSPYSASKIAADQIAISYFRSFDQPIKIICPFNVYGPKQSERAIIPTIINQLLNNNGELHLGNINTSRDFTYVDDTCLGFYEIYKSSDFFGEVINIGSNKTIFIKDLVEIISSKMNKKITIVIDDKRVRPKLSEVDKLLCDNNKLLLKTNWRPNIDIFKGLDLTIDWYYKNNKKLDLDYKI